jgi:hypothetical protein
MKVDILIKKDNSGGYILLGHFCIVYWFEMARGDVFNNRKDNEEKYKRFCRRMKLTYNRKLVE